MDRVTFAVTNHVRRLGGWWLVVVLAIVVVAFTEPQAMSVLPWKILQVAVAITIGYVADRTLYLKAPDIDKDMPRDQVTTARLICRAIIVLGVIIGLTTGL